MHAYAQPFWLNHCLLEIVIFAPSDACRDNTTSVQGMTLIIVLGCAITCFLNLAVPILALRSLAQGRRRVRWWLVLGGSLFLSHVGISIGFHRYFSHRSFETSAAGKWFLATAGTLTMQGSPLYWAGQHRLHHRHCEGALDPHSPLHGFWHAHGGWLTGLTGTHMSALINGHWTLNVRSNSVVRWLV